MAARPRIRVRVREPVPFETILEKTEQYVRALITESDAFPVWTHCQRIAKTAERIVAGEVECTPPVKFDGQEITLAALLHHCIDPRYIRPADEADTLVSKFLVSVGYPKDAAEKVQLMCSHATCVDGLCTPALASQLCAVIPELQVMQDAVRIDQVGVIGILKAFDKAKFAFGDAWGVPEARGRMLGIAGKMKTKTGRLIAQTRIVRAVRILEEYEDEALGHSRQMSKVPDATPRSDVVEIEDHGAPSGEEIEVEAGDEDNIAPRPLKRASFLAPMANNSRKRATSLSTEEEQASEADILAASTSTFDTPPIMTGKMTFLRRPNASGEIWTCTEGPWAKITYERKLIYTHAGLMMETTDGTDCDPPCHTCSYFGHTCRKYRPECGTAYKNEHGLAVPTKCANCLLTNNSCVVPSKRRRH